jgi:hypothetical protein
MRPQLESAKWSGVVTIYMKDHGLVHYIKRERKVPNLKRPAGGIMQRHKQVNQHMNVHHAVP